MLRLPLDAVDQLRRQTRTFVDLQMLKNIKGHVAIHGTENHSLSHFYYSSLEPPRTDMEERSADRIAKSIHIHHGVQSDLDHPELR